MPSIQVGYSSTDLTGAYWPVEAVQTSAVTGTNNDLAVNTTAFHLIMSGAAPVITGFATGRTGRLLFVEYTGAGTLVINHQDTGSSAANRVITGAAAAVTIKPNGWAMMVYYSSRWNLIAIPDRTIADVVTGLWTFSGGITMSDSVLLSPEIKDYAQTKTAPTISGGTLTLNHALGNVFVVDSDANITTLTISNWPATGKKGSIELWLKGTGSAFTQAWGTVRWPSDVTPTLTTTNGDYTVITFHTFDGGTTVFGCVAAQAW
jgi:hypothetical protein